MTTDTKRPVFEVTVPRCSKIPRGVVAPRLVASDRGWTCPTHGGFGCADKQSHLNLKKSREAAQSDPLAVRLLAAVKRRPNASVPQLRKMADPKAGPGESRVPKVLRYLTDAGMIPTRPRVAPASPDFTVRDVECSHPVTIDSYMGAQMVGRRCVECSTLIPL